MTFDWTDYLHLARQLAARTEEWPEAALRSAISRSYYGAFCGARNHLRDKENQRIPPGAAAHAKVRDVFEKSRDEPRKEIAFYLDTLRRSRNRADYDDTFPDLRTSAAAACELADAILARLAAL